MKLKNQCQKNFGLHTHSEHCAVWLWLTLASSKPPVDESSVLYQNPVRRKFGGRQKFRCRQKFCKTCRRKFSSSPKYWPQPGRVRRKGSGRPKGVFPRGCVFLCFKVAPIVCSALIHSTLLGASLKHKNTQHLYIFNRENPQNSEPQNVPRSGLGFIAC